MAKKETTQDILKAIMEKGGGGSKGAEALKVAADALNDSANSQKNSSSKLDKSSESINEASKRLEDSVIKQSKILESVKDIVVEVRQTLKNLVKSVDALSYNNSNVSGKTNKNNYADQKEVFNSLVNINENILQATKVNTEVLYDILNVLSSNKRESIAERRSAGGGRGGRGAPPPPPTGGGRGGSSGGGFGGILAGAGALLGGLGKGFVGAGVGALLGLLAFENIDAKKIKQNVTELLSIADEVSGGKVQFLFEGGAFGLAMAGIGAGLAVFSIGQAAQALAQFVSDSNWTQTLKNNVVTLLSLSDTLGGNWEMLKEGGAFTLAMTGIGLGLAAFGTGQAVAAVAQFISNDGWAQRIVDNVKTLLSISELKNIGWNTAGFVAVMGGIATGLLAFTLGQGLNVAVDAVDKAISYFTGDNPFAERIKKQVETLLSISQLPGIGWNTAGFVATMAGISAGLVAFTTAQGLNVAVDSVDKAIAYFSGDKPFADRIYDQVSKLLSLTNIQTGDSKSFSAVMLDIVAGLTAFSAGNFADNLIAVGTKIVSFLSGKENPIDRVLEIAKSAGDLEKGANALQKIATALSTFSNIKTGNLGDIDFEGMAKNLGAAIPLLNLLAKGGVLSASGPLSWIGLKSDVDFGKGILDPSLRLNEMATAISKINYVLGRTNSIENPAVTAVQGNQLPATQTINQAAANSESPSNVVVNNNNVNNNYNGGAGAREPKIGGDIRTSPPQSHIDRSMYGWADLHSATP